MAQILFSFTLNSLSNHLPNAELIKNLHKRMGLEHQKLSIVEDTERTIMTKNVLIMKIAVPTKNDEQLADQFENFEFYTIFCISDDNEIMAETILETPNDDNCEFQIASDLAEMGVNIMLVGQINDLLSKELTSHEIHLICNCEGNIYELVEKYLAA